MIYNLDKLNRIEKSFLVNFLIAFLMIAYSFISMCSMHDDIIFYKKSLNIIEVDKATEVKPIEYYGFTRIYSFYSHGKKLYAESGGGIDKNAEHITMNNLDLILLNAKNDSKEFKEANSFKYKLRLYKTIFYLGYIYMTIVIVITNVGIYYKDVNNITYNETSTTIFIFLFLLLIYLFNF